MALEGLHHVTAITGDAQGNVDFYARTLGLRFVKKTVNHDAPDVYHLYYADEQGTPGSVLTFFEFPGASPGRAGDGMVHRIQWRVASAASLEFWVQRLGGAVSGRDEGSLRFADPEGLEHELVVFAGPDAPLVAEAADVPPEHALQGFHGVRAYAAEAERSRPLLDAMGFDMATGELAGESRRATYAYDASPEAPGIPGAGTVHHVAWSAADDAELESGRLAVSGAGAHPTPIIDRLYFHSVYFREPSGVLFELATRDLGFTVDEPLESLGQSLVLPPQHEHLRVQLERTLTPLRVPSRT